MITGTFLELETVRTDEQKSKYVMKALINISTELGVQYKWNNTFGSYAGSNLYSCLLSLEALYRTYISDLKSNENAEKVEYIIKRVLSLSEIDIGIDWRDGAFWPSGAKLLDEALVNENLKWLADKDYHDILALFEKGLRHFLEAVQKPERLWDTVTDVYESVEALVKRITDRDRDLSANAELFINKLKLSEYYKKMLKDYIAYANDYSRHAAKLGEVKQTLLRNEVEAFIYTSGLFIRLAVQQMAEESS